MRFEQSYRHRLLVFLLLLLLLGLMFKKVRSRPPPPESPKILQHVALRCTSQYCSCWLLQRFFCVVVVAGVVALRLWLLHPRDSPFKYPFSGPKPPASPLSVAHKPQGHQNGLTLLIFLMAKTCMRRCLSFPLAAERAKTALF